MSVASILKTRMQLTIKKLSLKMHVFLHRKYEEHEEKKKTKKLGGTRLLPFHTLYMPLHIGFCKQLKGIKNFSAVTIFNSV